MGRGLICLLVFMCTGCGLIIQGREQTVRITTTPTGANVKIPDTIETTTPFKISLDRTQSHLLEISKPGYQEKWVVLQKEKSWLVIIADVLLSGPIGPIIDWRLGTWNHLRPSKVDVTLDQIGDASLSTPVEFQLTDSSVILSDPTVRISVYRADDANAVRKMMEAREAGSTE